MLVFLFLFHGLLIILLFLGYNFEVVHFVPLQGIEVGLSHVCFHIGSGFLNQTHPFSKLAHFLDIDVFDLQQIDAEKALEHLIGKGAYMGILFPLHLHESYLIPSRSLLVQYFINSRDVVFIFSSGLLCLGAYLVGRVIIFLSFGVF
jgi:hypothetical protein